MGSLLKTGNVSDRVSGAGVGVWLGLRHRRLQTRGLAADAQVVAVCSAGPRSLRGRRLPTLRLMVHPHGGAAYEVTTRCAIDPSQELEQLPGAWVRVLIDPRRRSTVVVA